MWPSALQQLISAGADVNCEDDYGRRPIHLAVALDEILAVEMLKADCALITPENTYSLLQLALDHQFGYRQGRIEIPNLVIDGLIDRHERLRNLAFSVLPDSSPVRQRLSDSCLIESLAPTVIHELRKNNISIPTGLELDGKDIYDTCDFHSDIRLTPTLAERLWVGGFRRINDYFDHDSRAKDSTPILAAWYNADFEMVSWFISKGASPFSKQRKLPISGLHVYAKRLSFPGAYFRHETERVHTSTIHLEQLIQEGTCYRDNCSCVCSPEGCTPVSIFIKSISRYQPPGYDEFCTKLKLFWKKLLPGSNPEPEQLEESLRALIFRRFLEPEQHTCCSISQLGQAMSNPPWCPKAAKEAIKPELDFETMVAFHREKMAKCYCPSIEKPLCVVFWDDCQTIANGGKIEK
ncbi:hypothetical protein F4820DRAFT_407287 [Hypoxylon rubiginosum]|uniref:Uncharacterized protein n=1 Tax=Hypoxylon rubiginosum TaxID=110542 RepID=A0ACB9ZEH0_9PEZI|nr:hypothetical protein F4820DRAFT_407287 [Hypoxylon rubiginosum]